MLSKKYICGILLLLCFVTLTCVSAADDSTSTDNQIAMTNSDDANIGEASNIASGYDTNSLNKFSTDDKSVKTASNGTSSGFGGANFNISSLNFTGLNTSGFDLSSLNFSSLNFSGMNSSGYDLSKLNISGMGNGSFNLSGLNTSGMNLSGLNLSSLNFSSLNFSSLNFTGLNTSGLNTSNLTGLNLSSLNLSSLNLSDLNLSSLNFTGMNFTGMNSSGFNLSNLNLSGIDLSSIDLSKLNISSLFNFNNTTDTNATPEETQNDTPQEVPQIDDQPKEVKKVKEITKPKVKSQTTNVKKIAQTTAKTFTIKRLNDSSVLYQGDSIVTLDEFNKIFDSTFNNGHLVVYIDGEVVFNDTVTGDLASQIFEIIEKFLGEHNIKVEFTDNDNKTSTFEENVLIE